MLVRAPRRVIVPAVEADCPAHRALSTEGIEHLTWLVAEDTDYGKIVNHLWKQGEGFTIIEHDVVPWPGAVDGLERCTEPWCVHWFPLAPNAIRPAMGCVRFSTGLVQAHPDLCDEWEGALWNELDGKVYPTIIDAVGHPHRHRPDVAHLKSHVGQADQAAGALEEERVRRE